MFWFLAFIVFVGILIFGVKAYIYGNDDFWPKLGIPFVEGHELGTFWERITFKLAIHELEFKAYKTIKSKAKALGLTAEELKIEGKMEFRTPIAVLMDVDTIKQIMVKDFDHFTNRRQLGRKNDPTGFDKMLFNMNNPEWKDMRTTLSPTFTTGKIRRMFDIFTESSNKMADFLRVESAKSPDIDMRDVCGRYTMNVVASVAFGVESQNFSNKDSVFALMGHRFQTQSSSWAGTLKLVMAFMTPRLFSLLRLSFFDFTVVKFFGDVIQETIQHRDSSGEKRNDFLQLLMECRPGGEDLVAAADGDGILDKESFSVMESQKGKKIPFTDDIIVAQCVLFFIAGFDGVENLFMYGCYELALNPDIQRKLLTELNDAVDESGELSCDVVNQLEYLDMVISETLRKYPVSHTERKCVKDYKLPNSNVVLKKDQIVNIPIYSIHHDEDIYPEPEKFIPERFSKVGKNGRNPYTFIPFGAGPRICIANRFALAEGKAAIAHMVLNFELKPTTRTTIPMKYLPSATLKPIDGMWLNVTPRK